MGKGATSSTFGRGEEEGWQRNFSSSGPVLAALGCRRSYVKVVVAAVSGGRAQKNGGLGSESRSSLHPGTAP